MRGAIVPVLVLAAAALSTGVMLQPSETYPESNDSQNPPSECDVLKKLFCKKANWMSENDQLNRWKIFVGDTDNNLEADEFIEYFNEYLNKGKDVDDDGYSRGLWDGYPIQFSRIQKSFEKLYNEFITSIVRDAAENPSYYQKNVPNISLMYLRNKNILIENDRAHYLYDTYVATTNPFDVVKARFSCLYTENNPKTPYQAVPQAATEFNKEEEREGLDTNEISLPMEDVSGKRSGGSETGQREIPDNLLFDEEEKVDIRKKLFSFWSRLQGLSHKGRQLPTRRHSFVYYGPGAGAGSELAGPLTAETRAAHLRPPGQPLRWG